MPAAARSTTPINLSPPPISCNAPNCKRKEDCLAYSEAVAPGAPRKAPRSQ